MPRPALVLASSSPRRVDLLATLGIDPVVMPPEVPETPTADETPAAHCERLAHAKARAVAARWGAGEAAILAADTVVALDGRILGKPTDAADARAMLQFLAGREHRVLTAAALVRLPGGRAASRVDVTRVRFRPYGDDVIDWYLGSGEPYDKAGAYSIQGRGALLAAGIDGSWSNVVGLPLEILPGLFAEVGLDLLGFAVGPA
jgi:septum formation protein